MEVSDITYTTAKFRGEIITAYFLIEHGFCWSINNIPTKEDNYINLGDTNTVGLYYANVENLIYNTTYYVRSYVKNMNDDIMYGNIVSFATLIPEIPIIGVIEDVHNPYGFREATFSSEIKDSSGVEHIGSYGFCWSKTIKFVTLGMEDDLIDLGSFVGVGQYEARVRNLDPETIYYVRAYATIENIGTGYSSNVWIFKTGADPCVCVTSNIPKPKPQGMSAAMRLAQRIKTFGYDIVSDQAKTANLPGGRGKIIC